MNAVIENAELAVRNLLKDVSRRLERSSLHATDFMDDGSEIRLRVDIDPATGDTTMDFSGTSDEV